MIRNVFGKALTESTLLILPEYKNKVEIKRQDLAKLALSLKNTQGKGKDEAEAVKYVENLSKEWREDGLTLGWIYNATGAAITLVDGRNWDGSLLSSNPYPVQIENGQWGFLVIEHDHSRSFGAVVYEALDSSYQTCCWSVAWKVSLSTAQVYVKIESRFRKNDDEWKVVQTQVNTSGPVHRMKQQGLRSVISTSPGPRVVFEALLTLDQSSLPENSWLDDI